MVPPRDCSMKSKGRAVAIRGQTVVMITRVLQLKQQNEVINDCKTAFAFESETVAL